MSLRISCHQITREIGVGGFSTVYVARDPLLEREVALKVMRPHPDRAHSK